MYWGGVYWMFIIVVFCFLQIYHSQNDSEKTIPLSPRTARKAKGFWRERKQGAALRGTTAAAERPKESPTLSSRAEVEAVLSRLFSLWLAPSSLGLFWRGLRLWLHLLLHWGSRGCSLGACYLLRQACEAIIRDANPQPLFKEEGEAHSLVGTCAIHLVCCVCACVNDPYIVYGLARIGFCC